MLNFMIAVGEPVRNSITMIALGVALGRPSRSLMGSIIEVKMGAFRII